MRETNADASHAVHEQSEDSINHEAIEKYEEEGPSVPKRKRGRIQMSSVHGRKENDELQMENRPVDVPESHFKDLEYWNFDHHKVE